MLTMTEIDDIRDAYYKKGKGISEIAKKFGKDRKTVRKYVRKEDFNWTRKESATGKCQPKLIPTRGRSTSGCRTIRRLKGSRAITQGGSMTG